MAPLFHQAIDVDEEWLAFQRALRETYVAAAQAVVLAPPALSAEQSAELTQWGRARQSFRFGSLGGSPSFRRVPRTYKACTGSMRQRKLANWVARAIRLAQVLGRTDAAGRQEADNLVSKLQLGQRPSWLQLQELIQDRSSQLGEAEATDRRLRLQDWRRAMLQDPARRKRWLQKPSKVCVPDVVFEDATLRTDEDIVEAIASYWQHTWRAAAGISQRTGPEASVSRPASTGAACRSAPGPTGQARLRWST